MIGHCGTEPPPHREAISVRVRAKRRRSRSFFRTSSRWAERNDDVARASRDHITIGRRTTVISAAGLLAALATSSCCLLPFLFVTVGVSGAWIGNLTALAPFQPIFFLLTVVLVGSAST